MIDIILSILHVVNGICIIVHKVDTYSNTNNDIIILINIQISLISVTFSKILSLNNIFPDFFNDI